MLFISSFTKKNLQKYLDYILIFFLIIQPLFDLKIFYNSISTLIRVIIIGLLFIIYFFISKNDKKYWFLFYPCVLSIYFIFHHINATNFFSLVPGNFNYSVCKEVLYFIKMLMPYLLIYCIYKSNLTNKYIFTIIKLLILIIGLVIIISNIFIFSYGSYSDEIIKANFFSWFSNSNEYTYQDLSSKGLFEYANQIGAILLMFLPFCLISFIEKKSLTNLFVILVNMFSLFLLGTKVSVLGVFLVFGYTILNYLFYNILLSKQKVSFSSVSITIFFILCYSLIFTKNPIFMRINETKAISTYSDSIENTSNDNLLQEHLVTDISFFESEPIDSVSFVKQNYKNKEIKEEFITVCYPYQYDADFWIKIFDEPRSNRVNYRFIEQSMVRRVIEINNNKFDKFLGISNTRIQNIFNIEKDFIVQYYALGLLGVIVIFFPYLAIIVFYIYKIFQSNFKCFNIINSISIVTIMLCFGISYFSGNLLNSLSFTIYFSIIFAFMIKNLNHNNKI